MENNLSSKPYLDQAKLRYEFFKYFSPLGILFTFVYAPLHWRNEDHSLAVVYWLVAVAIAMLWYLSRDPKKTLICSQIFTGLGPFVLLPLQVTGGIDGTGLYWFFAYIIFAMLFVGLRSASIWLGLTYFASVLLLAFQRSDIVSSYFSINTMLNFYFASAIIYVLAAFFIVVRKGLEDQLQSKSAALEQAQNVAKLGSWEWDMQNDKVTWSDNFYKIFDVPTGTKLDFNGYLKLIHKDDANQVKETIRRAAKYGGPFSVVHRIRDRHGLLRWIKGDGEVVTDSAGHPVAMIGTAQDITETKNVEMEVTDKNKQLENSKIAILNVLEDLDEEKRNLGESKAKDEAVLQSIGDCLVTVDSEGKIVLVNKAFEKTLGLKESEVIGKEFHTVMSVYSSNGEKISKPERLISKVLASGETMVSAPDQTYLYQTKSGSKFPAAITVAPILVNNNITGAVEIFRDITREKEIDRTKTEFVSLASHQLRTPLSTINWYSEMLLEGDAGKINDEQKKYLEEIFRGNKRMTQLVNDLLNVSRIDLGTFIVEPEPTDILALAKSIVLDLEPKIFKRKIKFSEDYGKNIPKINVDPKLMRMLIENLCSNAIKYTPEGGAVTIKIAIKNKKLNISVKDTGYGIPKSQQDKIFSKLFRADNIKSTDTEGTGLGLYLVKSIINYSGGKIRFTSAQNKGTTFFVELPREGMKQKKGTKRLD